MRRVPKIKKKLSKLSQNFLEISPISSPCKFPIFHKKKKKGKEEKKKKRGKKKGRQEPMKESAVVFESSKWAQYFTDGSILGAVLRRGCTPCN